MSRNSKNARKIQRKRDWRNNKPGPAKTKKHHTKVKTWYSALAGKAVQPTKQQKQEEDSE